MVDNREAPDSETNMDCRMYKAAINGSFEALKNLISLLDKPDRDPLLWKTAHKGNNLLHIAANMRHVDFACKLLQTRPELSGMQNYCGDTPLHLAARNGCLEVVKVIVNKCSFPKPAETNTPVSSVLEGLEGGRKEGRGLMRAVHGDRQQILRSKSMNGNIPLQEALRNGHATVSRYLWGEGADPITTLRAINGAGESTLYLAAQSGFPGVVKMMVDVLNKEETFKEGHKEDALGGGPDGQNPLHAAVYSGSYECVEVLINSERLRPFINKPDKKGRTAQHFTAETGDEKIARVLLQNDESSAYVKDVNGRTPLLEAASCGNWSVLEEILRHCPDTVEYCVNAGENALHLILTKNMVRPSDFHVLAQLVNEPDKKGDTPLHTAAKHQNYKMVKRLLNVPWVDPRATNQLGFTALDICETQWPSVKWIYLSRHLKNRYAARGQIPYRWKLTTNSESELNMPGEDPKKMAQTLSVVAVLLASITFAAGFTIPAGYVPPDSNNSTNNETLSAGSSVLASKASIEVFILADTVAVSCSLTVVFGLIFSMLGDQAFLSKAITYNTRLLYVALCGTLIAFMAGIFAVISVKVMWEAIVVCAMESLVPFLIKYLRKKSYIESIKQPRSSAHHGTSTRSSIGSANNINIAWNKISPIKLKLPCQFRLSAASN